MLVTFLTIATLAWPQAAGNANSGYKTEQGRANVAKTLLATDRDGRQKPKELIEAMQIKPGNTVVDLGTGAGYMLPFLSAAVGSGGKVLAEDIFDDFLKQAKETASKNSLSNVEFIKGTDRDPKLPENAVDIVFTLDAYHHFDYPAEMLSVIAKSLKPGGRFILVDFYKSGFRDPAHIRLDQVDVIKEVESNGFRLLTKADHMPGTQYIAIFTRK
jgi:ubiquinone/menaquinone biosynthesis C-methylase UbiE